MAHRYRIKTAWFTYLGIQGIWLSLVLATPVVLSLYPSKLWAVPFCGITAAGGLHMMVFYREYNALLRKAVRLFPFERYVLRYLVPARRDPRHFLLFGSGYTLFGVVSAALVIFA
ncbi:MAG: hypothetical protein ACR2JR_03890 [Rubrobacteraceae bacterium]